MPYLCCSFRKNRGPPQPSALQIPDSIFHISDFNCQVSSLIFQVTNFRFLISDLGFQIPDFRFQLFQILDIRIQNPYFRFRISGFRFQIPDFMFHVSYFRSRVSNVRFHIPTFRNSISDFRFQFRLHNSSFPIPDFRFQISDFIIHSSHFRLRVSDFIFHFQISEAGGTINQYNTIEQKNHRISIQRRSRTFYPLLYQRLPKPSDKNSCIISTHWIVSHYHLWFGRYAKYRCVFSFTGCREISLRARQGKFYEAAEAFNTQYNSRQLFG